MNYRKKYCKKGSRLRRSKFTLVLFVLKCLGIDILVAKWRIMSFTDIFTRFVITLLLHVHFFERLFLFGCLAVHIPLFIPLTFGANVILGFILWYTIYCKKKRIKCILNRTMKLYEMTLLRNTVDRSKKQNFPKFVNLMTIIVCILPVLYGPAEYLFIRKYPRVAFYMNPVDWNSTLEKSILLLRSILSSVWRDTFPVAFCMMYTLMCWHISKILSHYTDIWIEGLKEGKSNLINVKTIAQYTSVQKLIEDIDACFSEAIFQLGVSNGLSLFGLMAFVLKSTQGLSSFVILQVCVIMSTACISLFTTIMMAAQVSLTVDRNLNHLCRLYEAFLSTPSKYKIELSLAELLEVVKKKPVRILSGCHILYYKRSLLLATAGTLFTYGLLVINFKKD